MGWRKERLPSSPCLCVKYHMKRCSRCVTELNAATRHDPPRRGIDDCPYATILEGDVGTGVGVNDAISSLLTLPEGILTAFQALPPPFPSEKGKWYGQMMSSTRHSDPNLFEQKLIPLDLDHPRPRSEPPKFVRMRRVIRMAKMTSG